MEPTTQVTIVIGLIGLWGVGLQMTGSKFAGLFLMTMSALSIWWLFNPTSSSLLWGGWGIIILLHAVYGVWIGGAEARIQGKQELPASSPPLPPGLFEIEILEGELYWRDAGTHQLVPFTPDPDSQTPETAIVVLALYLRITAIPTQLLENIELAIVGQLLTLSSGYWHLTEISGERSNYFYFDLPPSIPLGKHPVRLVATTSLRGASSRKEFPPFDTYTARTYHQLHAYDPQKFPNPS